jgi:hypothetical protein
MSLYTQNKLYNLEIENLKLETKVKNKKQKNIAVKQNYAVQIKSPEFFSKTRTFDIDWQVISGTSFLWEFKFENFDTRYLSNFEWKILTKAVPIAGYLGNRINGYFIYTNTKDIIQTVTFQLMTFPTYMAGTTVWAKPLINYHGLITKGIDEGGYDYKFAKVTTEPAG